MNAPITVAEEDQARAGLYALLARLLVNGPDGALLGLVAQWGATCAGDSPVAQAARALAQAAASTDPKRAQLEYDTVFLGVGKAPVTPYLSHYLVRVAHERVLVGLRDELAQLGLARDGEATEPEDHVAAVLEVMRHLALRTPPDAALHTQRAFFDRYLAPAYAPFCAEVLACDQTGFYRPVATLLQRFLEAEQDAFELT